MIMLECNENEYFWEILYWNLENASSKSCQFFDKAKFIIFLSFRQILDNAVAAHFFSVYYWLLSLSALGRGSVVSILGSEPLDPRSIPGAAMLDGSFILAASAIHLITVVPACLLGLT